VVQRMKGAAGADTYLSLYGKGIGAPKVIELARKAEAEGDAQMARRFWEVAYRLEMSSEPPAVVENKPIPSKDAIVPNRPISPKDVIAPNLRPALKEDAAPFPVQPGELATMQPTDAPHDREWYVNNPAYWGQPKIYGHRLVVFATPEKVWYQARSLLLQGPPSAEIDAALRDAAAVFGPFILDGEKYYLDCTGKERMTGAQAATVNVQNGQPDRPIPARYAIFRCLFYRGKDLRPLEDRARLDRAGEIYGWLEELSYDRPFRFLWPACSEAEKRALIERQTQEGREGEVWFIHSAPYVAGKGNKHVGQPITVRTKYRNTLDVFVTALDPTTVEGRAFAAMRVAVFCEGRRVNLGRVGTGFTWAQTFEIRDAFERGPLVVEITTQGFTENRAVVHGSFVQMRPDKTPMDCIVDPEIF
jgi:ATP-dependent DNA ligase